MPSFDPKALAGELMSAYASCQTIAVLPTARDPEFDLDAAYAVEAELTRLRRERGRTTIGRKVGYANKATWRVLKLDTLVWASMYDDTLIQAKDGIATLPIGKLCAPKIEPEIVFKLRSPPVADGGDPAAALEAVEWIALGFEVIDCVFPDWKFQPADFVASFGMHAGLVVGEPRSINDAEIPALVDTLAQFKVRLSKDGELVQEGSGRNVLRSPALCLAELASAVSRRPNAEPLTAGELISSGALTDSQFVKPGESWSATTEDLGLRDLTVKIAG